VSRKRRGGRALDGPLLPAITSVAGQRAEPPPEPQFGPGRRRTGRPTMLRPEAEERYFQARRAGNSMADSARYAGLEPATVESWIRRGKGLLADRPATPEYVRFYRMDEEAKAQVRVLVVGNIVARSRVDFHAALAWLRVHGGPEWVDAVAPGEVGPAPSLGTGQTLIDQSHATVVMLPREAVPELVHEILERRRREMAALEPVNVTPPHLAPRRNGASRAAREGLRTDAD
jgi:hypothetical protein